MGGFEGGLFSLTLPLEAALEAVVVVAAAFKNGCSFSSFAASATGVAVFVALETSRGKAHCVPPLPLLLSSPRLLL